MNSYNKFTYLLIFVTPCSDLSYTVLNLYLQQTYTHSDLTLMADLFLFRSPIGHIFILISRRTHTYIDSLVCGTELIHILIRRYLSTYSYLYLSQISRRSSQKLCLYRDTLRYYKPYTYTTEFTLVRRYP